MRATNAFAFFAMLTFAGPSIAEDEVNPPEFHRVALTVSQNGEPLANTVLKILNPRKSNSTRVSYKERWEEQEERRCGRDYEYVERKREFSFTIEQYTQGQARLWFAWEDEVDVSRALKKCRNTPESEERNWDLEVRTVLVPGETERWEGDYGLVIELRKLEDQITQ